MEAVRLPGKRPLMNTCHGNPVPDMGECPTCHTPGPRREAELRRRAQSAGGNPEVRAMALEREHAAVYGDVPHPADEAGPVDEADEEPASRLAAVPKFPVADLVGPLADLVGSSEFPAPLLAGWGLGILAGLCGMADITIGDSLPLAGPLWVMCIAKRGRAKTPSFDYAAQRLRQLEVDARRDYKQELAEWRKVEADKNMPHYDRPVDPARMLDDITIETVAKLLDRRDGTGLLPVDELSGWFGRMGKYGSNGPGAERGRWLSMWSAQPWSYQRTSDGKNGDLGIDIMIERPVVSIVGGIQPGLLGVLGSDTDGFPPRWLPFWYDGPKTGWAGRIYHATEWESAIDHLYTARYPREWRLTGEALDLWRSASSRWTEQAEGDEASITSAALDKSDIQCAAVAKVIAESMHPGRGGDIPLEAMTCAIAIVDYAMDCWRAMPGNETFAMSRKDEVLDNGVNKLVDWLDERKPHDLNGQMVKWIKASEIKEKHIAGIRTASEAMALIERYRAVYPGHVIDYRPAGGGRPGKAVIAPQRDEQSA